MDTLKYILDKYKVVVRKEYIIEIPNMGRNDLAVLFAELGYKTGAEVGVALGQYSEVLCKANPGVQLFCVDPWTIYSYEPGIDPAGAGIVAAQEDYEKMYASAVKRLAPYNCTIVRESSMNAVRGFQEESLDFVYIDANHDFVNFTLDLHYWTKRVRRGGIISGHDYAYFSYRKHNHVKRVMEAYTRCYRMVPYFVAGTDEVRPGEIRDRFRSWFWVKE